MEKIRVDAIGKASIDGAWPIKHDLHDLLGIVTATWALPGQRRLKHPQRAQCFAKGR